MIDSCFKTLTKQEYKTVDNNEAKYTNQDKNCSVILKASIQSLLDYCSFRVSNKYVQHLIGAPMELIPELFCTYFLTSARVS